jgi:hypothetical protein
MSDFFRFFPDITSGLDRHFGQLQGNEDKGMKRRTSFCRHSFAVILLPWMPDRWFRGRNDDQGLTS